jgi:hypothetical protein
MSCVTDRIKHQCLANFKRQSTHKDDCWARRKLSRVNEICSGGAPDADNLIFKHRKRRRVAIWPRGYCLYEILYEIPDRLLRTRIPWMMRAGRGNAAQLQTRRILWNQTGESADARERVSGVVMEAGENGPRRSWRDAAKSELADRVGVTHPSRLCAGSACRYEELELLGRNSRTVKISLGLLAAERVENFQLLYGLDAFCNRAQAIGSRQCDYR